MKYSWNKSYESKTARGVRWRKISLSRLSSLFNSVKNLTKGKIILFFSIFVFFSIIYFLVWSPFFNLQTVRLSDPAVASIIKDKFGSKNTLFLKQQVLEQYVVENEPRVKGLSVEKIYPRTIKIDLFYREPLAVVLSDINGSTDNPKFLIDEQGVVFSEATSSAQLPGFNFGSKQIKVGDRLSSENVVKYLQILSGLKRGGIEVARLKVVDEKTVEVQVLEGPVVLFSSTKSAGEQIEALQVILTKYKIKETLLAKVDLRYDKPVVAYKN